MIEDVRYGLRQLRKNPGFATVAILTLALGIGAAAAMFGLIQGVLLPPPPYADPARIVLLAQLGTAAEKFDDPSVFRRFVVATLVVAEQAERLQRFHRPLRSAGLFRAKPVTAIDAVLQPLI